MSTLGETTRLPQKQQELKHQLDPKGGEISRLPVELLFLICDFLDNRSMLQLGIAWKWFLQCIVPSLDPQHPIRKRLSKACMRANNLPLATLLQSRYRYIKTIVDRAYFKLPILEAWLDLLDLDLKTPLKTNRILLFKPPQNLVVELWRKRGMQLQSHLRTQLGVFSHRISYEEDPRDLDWQQFEQALTLTNFLWILKVHTTVPVAAFTNALSVNRSLKLLELCDFVLEGFGKEFGQDLRNLATSIANHSTLESLECGELPWTGEATRILFTGGLRRLGLENEVCAHADVWIPALAGNRTLQYLSIVDEEFSGGSVCRQLCDALKHNPTLKQLYLRYSQLKGEDVAAIAELLMCPGQDLHELNLDGNAEIGVVGIQALARSLVHPNNKLRWLFLEGVDVTLEGVQALVSALATDTTRLELLVLSKLSSTELVMPFVELAISQGILEASWHPLDFELMIKFERAAFGPVMIRMGASEEIMDDLEFEHFVFRLVRYETYTSWQRPHLITTTIRSFGYGEE